MKIFRILFFDMMISIFQIIMDMTTVPYDLQKLLRLATSESHEQSDVLDLAKALNRRSRYEEKMCEKLFLSEQLVIRLFAFLKKKVISPIFCQTTFRLGNSLFLTRLFNIVEAHIVITKVFRALVFCSFLFANIRLNFCS